MITVTVNDRPIDVAAIVEHGRAFLPMRATFAALGATIDYDARGHVIVARSATHAVRLRVGSHAAMVDGRRAQLDVPARIVAARCYVPLRFVAQAMGAVVGFDARAKVVTVVQAHTADAIASLQRASVIGLTPGPQSVVASAYPTISASLGASTAANGEVTLTVDGQDVSALATFDGTTITYMPRIGLSRGPHTAAFFGRTLAGEPFNATWTFETSLQAPPDMPSPSLYDYRFYANGPTLFYPGDWMNFTLVAPPGGSALVQLCGLGFQYPLWNNGYGSVYEAHVPAPYGYWLPMCSVTAIYTAWNGRRYFVPIPVIVALYTAPQRFRGTPVPPTPAPRLTAHPIPVEPRRPEPTPPPALARPPAPKPSLLPIRSHPRRTPEP